MQESPSLPGIRPPSKALLSTQDAPPPFSGLYSRPSTPQHQCFSAVTSDQLFSVLGPATFFCPLPILSAPLACVCFHKRANPLFRSGPWPHPTDRSGTPAALASATLSLGLSLSFRLVDSKEEQPVAVAVRPNAPAPVRGPPLEGIYLTRWAGSWVLDRRPPLFPN